MNDSTSSVEVTPASKKEEKPKNGCLTGCLFCIIVFFVLAIFSGSSDTVITKEMYGDDYPFTIDNLKLKCENDAIWVVDDMNYVYPLNGLAEGKFKGTSIMKELEEIWLVDEAYIKHLKELAPNEELSWTPRKNISKIIDAASALCK